MMYFRPDPAVLDSTFLLHSIYGPVVRTYLNVEVNGSTVGHLRLGQVSALPLLWCRVEEQREIVEHIARECEPLDATISRFEREIELLAEYRTQLVANTVTGKLDVREMALRLPIESNSTLDGLLADETDEADLTDEEAEA
jgi:type I restriction enzyme S subunit